MTKFIYLLLFVGLIVYLPAKTKENDKSNTAIIKNLNPNNKKTTKKNENECPPKEYKKLTHCIESKINVKKQKSILKKLKKEGYKTYLEKGSNTIEIHLSAKELKKLFKAKYIYKLTQKHKLKRGMLCNAYVKGGYIPRRYKKMIFNFSVEHKTCESLVLDEDYNYEDYKK